MKGAKWILCFLLLVPVLFWYIATPWVGLNYSGKAQRPIRVFMFTPHEKYGDTLRPGESRGMVGEIFPDDDFFVRADWYAGGIYHCVNISPKWRETNVYIKEDGGIDWSLEGGTDIDRLSSCPEQ